MNKTSRLGLAAVLAIGAIGAVWYIQSQESEAQGGNIVAGQSILQVAIPAKMDATATLGKDVFGENCAACHGVDAGGLQGKGPPLVHKIYEPNHHGDMAFLRAAQNGVRSHHWKFGNMPKIEGITRNDIIAIVAYVRSLQRENGIN